mgnify:CR=1 FL=1
MRRCDKCGCLCDPGDLVNGICDDCREAERKQEENQEMLLRMMRGEVKQLRLEDVLNENFRN